MDQGLLRELQNQLVNEIVEMRTVSLPSGTHVDLMNISADDVLAKIDKIFDDFSAALQEGNRGVGDEVPVQQHATEQNRKDNASGETEEKVGGNP